MNIIEKLSKNLILIAIIIAGVLIAGAVLYVNLVKEGKIAGFLTAQQAAEKTINFINQHLVEPGMVVSLINVTEERGLYKISFKAGEQEYNSHVTKDGKLLFLQGIDMERGVSDAQSADQAEGGDEARPFSDEQLETLAKCLKEKGVKFYGTHWCPACTRQKEMFGQAVQYLFYIECASDRASPEELAMCDEANVESIPDWRFPDGRQESGILSLEKLAEFSGCQL